MSEHPSGPGLLFGPGPAGAFDEQGAATRQVVRQMDDGSVRMYYIGSNEVAGHGPADELALRHRIGFAASDGRDLTRWHRWGE